MTDPKTLALLRAVEELHEAIVEHLIGAAVGRFDEAYQEWRTAGRPDLEPSGEKKRVLKIRHQVGGQVFDGEIVHEEDGDEG